MSSFAGLLVRGTGILMVLLSPAIAAEPQQPVGPRAGVDLSGDPLPPHAVVRLGTLRFRTGTLLQCLAFAPDGSLATAAYTADIAPIRLWDLRSGRDLRRFPGPRSVFAMQFSRDGKTLIAADHGETVRLWDVQTGQDQTALGARKVPPHRVAWSADFKRFLTGDADGSLVLRDDQGTELRTLEGPNKSILALALSPDGKTAAARTARHTVHLWDTSTGKKHTFLPSSRWMAELPRARPAARWFFRRTASNWRCASWTGESACGMWQPARRAAAWAVRHRAGPHMQWPLRRAADSWPVPRMITAINIRFGSGA
jgi:WD40 repeat protein